MKYPKLVDHDRLHWISEDIDDDEPDIVGLIRSKKMHDVLQGRIPGSIGKVSAIWMESASNDQIRWLRFVYRGASFGHGVSILEVTMIPQIHASDYVSIRMTLSPSRPLTRLQQIKPPGMARWLTVVTGCRFLANDLENLGVLNQDDWIWHCRGSSSLEYRQFSDLICDGKNRRFWGLFPQHGHQILIFPKIDA